MITPSDGQNLAIKFGMESKYSILALPPGQGKTVCAVEISLRLKCNTLVVCPAYAKNIWVDEFKGQNPDTTIVIFDSSESIRTPWEADVCIVSYSLLIDRRNRGDINYSRDAAADLLFDWADYVIADECSALKELSTKSTQTFHKLLFENNLKYLSLLSGTPAKNRVHELYSLLLLCTYLPGRSSDLIEKYPTWVDFAEKFSYQGETRVKTKFGEKIQITYSGIRNEKELSTILQKHYFVLPEHLLEKMPERVDIEVRVGEVELVGEYEEFVRWSKDNKSTTPDIKAKAALITAPFTVAYVKGLLNEVERVVVFTDHIESSKAIASGLGVKAINSTVPLKIRAQILEDFQSGKSPAIVATIGTLSTAVSLTTSMDMVFNDPPWVPGDLEQAERRIRRRGQKNSCTYHRILGTKQTSRIYKVLNDKKETLDKINELAKRGN